MNTPPAFADVWGFFAGMGATAIVLGIIASIFWIWAIIDCASNTRLNSTEKIVWLLVIFFLHVLGAIVYAVVGRNRRQGESIL